MTKDQLKKRMIAFSSQWENPLQTQEINDFINIELENKKKDDILFEENEILKAYKQAVDNLKFTQYATKKDINQEIKKCNQKIQEYQEEGHEKPSIFLEFRIEDQVERKKKLQSRIKYMNTDKKDIETAKQVPITQFIEFNSAGFAFCVWHKEKTPSAKYYKQNNSIYCFSCARKGDVIDVVQAQHNCTLPKALKIILG